MKKCSKCGIKKNYSEFHKSAKSKDGFITRCKACIKSYNKLRRDTKPEREIWHNMIYRCTDEKSISYENYGKRGIKVSDKWLKSFDAFLEDMGTRPSPEHSIERIDNDGNYEKDNCCWATRVDQNRNQRIRKDNNSGHKGVGFNKQRNVWRARINVNKKSIYLGYFTKIEDAIKARKEAELKYWSNNGYYRSTE